MISRNDVINIKVLGDIVKNSHETIMSHYLLSCGFRSEEYLHTRELYCQLIMKLESFISKGLKNSYDEKDELESYLYNLQNDQNAVIEYFYGNVSQKR